jgi:hypothetical protein
VFFPFNPPKNGKKVQHFAFGRESSQPVIREFAAKRMNNSNGKTDRDHKIVDFSENLENEQKKLFFLLLLGTGCLKHSFKFFDWHCFIAGAAVARVWQADGGWKVFFFNFRNSR